MGIDPYEYIHNLGWLALVLQLDSVALKWKPQRTRFLSHSHFSFEASMLNLNLIYVPQLTIWCNKFELILPELGSIVVNSGTLISHGSVPHFTIFACAYYVKY